MFKRNSVVLSSIHTNPLVNPDKYYDENGNKLNKKKDMLQSTLVLRLVVER